MSRKIGKLTSRRVATAKPKRGRNALVLGDGGNLYLQCTFADDGVTVRRSWVFKYEIDGKRREMGLGPLHTISLAKARANAKALREQLVDDIDPLEAKEAARREKAAEAARTITFEKCAEMYLDLHAPAWGAAHDHQWRASLKTYVFPKLGKLAVTDIDQAHIMDVVGGEFWKTKPTTAGRVRARVEQILDFAAAHEFRGNDNPARHVISALPKKARLAPIQHHASVPWQEMPVFTQDLRQLRTTTAAAMEFLVLTAARRNEVLGAKWTEIEGGIWTVPAERMKARVEHRVPLSKRALDGLASLPKTGPFIFGGAKPLHQTALRKTVLARLRPGVTTHGMRAAFKTWAGERTNYPRETVEVALAHRIGDQTEQAYERGDKFQKRARLMEAWAGYLAKPAVTTGSVTLMQRAAR